MTSPKLRMEDWCKALLGDVLSRNEVYFDYCDPFRPHTFDPANFDEVLCCPVSFRFALRPASGAHVELYDRFIVMPTQSESDEMRRLGMLREYTIEPPSPEGRASSARILDCGNVRSEAFRLQHPYCVSLKN